MRVRVLLSASISGELRGRPISIREKRDEDNVRLLTSGVVLRLALTSLLNSRIFTVPAKFPI